MRATFSQRNPGILAKRSYFIAELRIDMRFLSALFGDVFTRIDKRLKMSRDNVTNVQN